MMTVSENRILEGLRSSSLASIGFLDRTVNRITSYFALYEENRRLRAQNTRLALENFQLQDALLENMRLRKLLQFKYESRHTFIPATVIGFSPQDYVSGLLLSSGDLPKVDKNAAVITAGGLVGKIVKISDEYAICQILLDPNSRVSVRVQRNRELGMVAWDGGNQLLLQNVPNTIVIKRGDVLFTSGLSRIFPPKIKVGVVSKVEKDHRKLFQNIQVKPAVNFKRLEEVLIMEETTNHEP